MKRADHQKTGIQAIHELRCLANTGDIEAIAAIRDVALYAIRVLQNLTLHASTPDLPDNYVEAGKNALQLAKESRFWPMAWDAIQEPREADLVRIKTLEIGRDLGIRLDRKPGPGRPRDFSSHGQTGVALDVWQSLEAIRKNPSGHLHHADIHPELVPFLLEKQLRRNGKNLAALLEPLSESSLPAWVAAGVEHCRDECSNSVFTPDLHDPAVMRMDMLENWENFPFGDCVKTRARSQYGESKKPLGTEKSVENKLRAGLTSLLP